VCSSDLGAYCNYDNNSIHVVVYGRLYNYYAVKDQRGLAPDGWHVPTDEEWTTLTTYLGGESIAGGKLKEVGTLHWISPNIGATNESGFTTLPSGFRYYDDGRFNRYGSADIFWSSNDYITGTAWSRGMLYDRSDMIRTVYQNNYGFSVRCIKD
jgi:uncharacterized protein (TIGR02145 family)